MSFIPLIRRGIWAIVLIFNSVSAAEEVVVPIPAFDGWYGLDASDNEALNAGIEFKRIDSVRVEWRGEITAGYGYEGGPECAFRAVVVPAKFSLYLNDGTALQAHGSTNHLGAATYPVEEPFDVSSPVDLWFGRTWEFFLDGACECDVQFWLDRFGFCTLDLIDAPLGQLSDVQLVITGARLGDFDENGYVDLNDAASLATCVTEIGSGDLVPECADADLDRDGDVNIADYAKLQLVFTGAGG